MTEHGEGNCVVCRRRDAESAYACSNCSASLRSLLVELPDLYALLGDAPDRQDAMSAGPVRAVQTGPRVSGGSVEPAAPIDLDVLDLTAPSRQGSRGPAARGKLGDDPDQIGHLSLPTTLDTWCRDWRETLWPSCLPPGPTVVEMCRWLADRVEGACQCHPAIDSFADEMRQYRGTIRHAAGYSDQPELVPGRCPRCKWKALHRLAADHWIRCGNPDCQKMLTQEDHDALTSNAA